MAAPGHVSDVCIAAAGRGAIHGTRPTDAAGTEDADAFSGSDAHAQIAGGDSRIRQFRDVDSGEAAAVGTDVINLVNRHLETAGCRFGDAVLEHAAVRRARLRPRLRCQQLLQRHRAGDTEPLQRLARLRRILRRSNGGKDRACERKRCQGQRPDDSAATRCGLHVLPTATPVSDVAPAGAYRVLSA